MERLHTVFRMTPEGTLVDMPVLGVSQGALVTVKGRRSMLDVACFDTACVSTDAVFGKFRMNANAVHVISSQDPGDHCTPLSEAPRDGDAPKGLSQQSEVQAVEDTVDVKLNSPELEAQDCEPCGKDSFVADAVVHGRIGALPARV